MKTIRILSLILALLMLAMPLVACNKDDAPDEGNNGAEEVADLQLVTKGESHYDIVFDYSAGEKTRAAINELVDAYKTFLGCEVAIRECYSDKTEEDGVNDVVADKEILIGMTNRPESQRAMDGLKTGDYNILIDGSKLVIVGGSDDATHNAVVRFMRAFVHEQGSKTEVERGNVLSLKVDQKTAVSLASKNHYSFSKTVVAGARIDSYALVYGVGDTEAQLLADEMKQHINKHAGYELEIYKNTNIKKADYMILIGETSFTDAALIEDIGEDEYYIALKKTETGAHLIVLYGDNAKDAAFDAFKEILPPSSTPIEINLTEGVLKTNKK